MIKVFILTAHLTGGFSMMPFDSEASCQAAMDLLPSTIVAEAECYPIEMLEPSNLFAPEMAPIPKPKPKRGEKA